MFFIILVFHIAYFVACNPLCDVNFIVSVRIEFTRYFHKFAYWDISNLQALRISV